MKPRNVALIVDDSPATLSFLSDALEEAEITTLVAKDGATALTLLKEITPDIVLMDAIMPGMDGFETCRRLKATVNLAHLPVIFMTALTETEHIVRALDAGGVDYVTKPIVPEELLARIHVHLANARLTQSARIALDASGRYLLAADRAGNILWSTPQATRLLRTIFADFGTAEFVLPNEIRTWLGELGGANAEATAKLMPLGDASKRPIEILSMGRIAADEFLLRLSEIDSTTAELRLQQRFSLTPREAQVLSWVSRGKSNRDVGAILGLSPRTVNKHLEQIYIKMGVENRTAAAALSTQAVESRN
jgi:DNA-binding response OmpR family regulator/DNA-binding CsgD family transcriptional regulator